MPNLYSKATGNWTTLGTFNTLANGAGVDTVPLNTHDVVIQSGHNVTLNSTVCVCKSLTVNAGGTLTASTSASNKLTAENDVVIDGTCTLDMSSDVTKICTILTNNANGSGSGTISAAGSASPAHNAGGMVFPRYTATITWKGFTRKRWTRTTVAITANSTTSFSVSDATGWQVGDRLILATTSAYNASPKIDVVTVGGISGNSVTSFTGTGTGGTTCANAHASDCLVINTTSNVVIGPAAAGRSGNVVFQQTAAATASKTINHVQFESLNTCSYFGLVSCAYPFLIAGCDFTDTGWVSFDSNAFYDFRQGNYGMMILAMVSAMTRSNNVHYHPNMSGLAGVDFIPAGVITATNYNTGCVFGTESDPVIVGAASAGIAGNLSSATILRPKISGMESAIFQQRSFGSHSIVDPDLQSNNNHFRSYFGTLNVNATSSTSAKIGTVVAATNVFKLGSYGSITATLTDCNFQSGGTFISNGSNAPASSNLITLVNGAAGGNTAVTAQEIYHPYGTVKRDNSNNKRSTSSVAIKPSSTGTDTQYTVTVPCANGATVRVIGYVKADTNFYNGGGSGWTAPTVTLSGLGATTQTFTASSAANNAWEQVDLSITNGSGSDGNFTLTFTANAKSVTTGTVYFDGMPTSSPFVTKARNYGFLFDQTAPNVTANITISASEATAGAYTGIAVTGGASTSSTVLSASKTFQQVYDYTQAWSCTTANLGYAIPLTGAGVAGSPVLFAAGTLTINTGYTLSGSGAINMGSYTLTTETATAQAYTYTGGSWSQATTVPAVSGGTLALSGEGTWTLTATGSPIITFAPTASGVTYAMGGSTFGGTIDLRNTHATRTITVELPSGTTYTTANNTGGSITVTLPVVTASISITSMPNAVGATNRLQIINATAVSAAARANSTAYSVGDIRLRQTGIGTENTAGLYLRCTTSGTSAGTPPTWNTSVGGTTTDGTVVWTTYAVLYYDADPASTSLSDSYVDGEEFLADEVVTIRCAEMDGATSFKTYSTSTVASSSGFSALVAASANEVYATNALDGSAYDSTYSPDYTNDRLVMDTNTDFSGKSAFAYFCYLLTTSQGMYQFWGGVTALDEGNYRIESDVLNMYFDETAGFVKQTDNVRFFRKDGTRPALDPTTGDNGIEINWRVPVNVVSTGGTALSAEESAKLMSLPNASSITSAIASRVLENGITWEEAFRIEMAVLAGQVSGGGTGTETFKGLDGTTDRVVSVNDANGNRTSVVVDGA